MFAMRPPVATKDFVAQAVAGLRSWGGAERVGVDSLNLEAAEGLKDAGIHLVDGWRALNKARAVKTIEELQLIRWTTRAKERGYDLVRQALRDSNVPEDQVDRIMLDYLLDQGFEAGSEFISIYDSSQDARPHTKPMGADLVVVEGDLVICDATVAGPGGYYSDLPVPSAAGNRQRRAEIATGRVMKVSRSRCPLIKPGPCTEFFATIREHNSTKLPGSMAFTAWDLCIYEAPWLRGGDPEEYGGDS